MTETDIEATPAMRTVRAHRFGGPEVLELERVPIPEPVPGSIRIAVYACALNPADAGVHSGMFGNSLPAGLGLDVSGVVDAIGAGVEGVALGDRVFGPSQASSDFYNGAPIGGASDFTLMTQWTRVPDGLDLLRAASFPLVAETAWRGVDVLGVQAGETVLIHGAGTVVGEAAVQFALQRGARVIATAGPARAAVLEALGARVTPYGEGMVERVREVAAGSIDRALDVSPGGALPALIELTGSPQRVVALRDFAAAAELGVETGLSAPRAYDRLGEIAALAVERRFSVPIGRTFPLEDFAAAAALAESGRPGGKILLTVLNPLAR